MQDDHCEKESQQRGELDCIVVDAATKMVDREAKKDEEAAYLEQAGN